MKHSLISIFFSFLFLSSLAFATTNIDKCTNLSTAGETYVLTQNIWGYTTTCMNITAANVILDCGGFQINGTRVASQYAINVTNASDIVKNCQIANWSEGIWANASSYNLTVQNNTFVNMLGGIGYGAITLNGAFNNITNNTVMATTNPALYFFPNTHNHNIEHNYLSSQNAQVVLILAGQAENNTFAYNNITELSNGNAIWFQDGSDNNTLIGNFINSSSTSLTGIIRMVGCNANNFTNNTMNVTGAGTDYAISLTGSNHSIFSGNTFQTIPSIANEEIHITATSGNNTFTRNIIRGFYWIADDSAVGNHYNLSGDGNYYFFLNDTAAWNLSAGGYNWTCSGTAPCFADGGSKHPANNANIGARIQGAGTPTDYRPYTGNPLYNETGLVLCNQTLSNATSIIYKFYDEQTLASINATITSLILYSNGTSKSITSTNATINICIVPPNSSINASLTEVVSSTGYQPINNNRASITYSNSSITYNFYLLNSSSGAYYTILVQNAYSAPLFGASVTAYHFLTANSTWIYLQSVTTDSTGSAIFFLIPANLYSFQISLAGYNPLNFSLTPATQTTIIVQLSQGTVVNPSNWSVINDTTFSVSPASGYYNTSSSIPLTYTISNLNSALVSWGMNIYKYNGTNTTLVYNGSSVVATGGSLVYAATPNNTYYLNAWFLHQNYSNYSIPTYIYYISSSTTGLAYVRQQLGNPNVIDGWTYYFISLFISIGIGIVTYKFGSGASAVAALISLWAFTLLAPSTMVIFTSPFGFDVQPIIASFILTIGTLAALYITSYGA